MFEIEQNEIKVISPLTGERLGNFQIHRDTDIERLIDQAEGAFEHWKNLSIKKRGEYLLKVRDLIYHRLEDIAQIISETTGKPKIEALTAELIPMLDFISYFVKRAPSLLADRKISLHLFVHKRSFLSFEPYGVVAILSPWNYPFSIPMADIVIALLTGNTILLKTSEAVLPVAKLIDDLFQWAYLPKGLVNVVFGDGRTGGYIVSSPRVKKIVFTGSTEVGRKILEQASKNLTPCVLELGGKDAAIVCEDADLKKAAKGIVWGAFTNAGQVCASVERVYVSRKISQKFIEAVVQETQKLEIKHDIGAITLPSQMDRYQRQLEEALKKGAKILVGGMADKTKGGDFFQPTLLINVSHDMAVMNEETFGPLLPMMMVDSDEEAIRLANHSIYGLTASIWTRNVKKGIEMARRIEAGTLTINDVVYTNALAETPWGGYKKSGVGRVHSDIGFREFVQVKHINYDRISLKPFWWFPYTKNSYETALAFSRFLGMKGFRNKLKAFFEFVSFYLFKK